MAKKPVNLRIDSELWERVQRSAKGRGLTATAVVEEALGRVLDQKVDLPEGRPWDDTAAHVEAHRVFLPPDDLLKDLEALPGTTTFAIEEPGMFSLTSEELVQRDMVRDEEAHEVVPTAKQLQGMTGLPLAACQRHLDNGTWRKLS